MSTVAEKPLICLGEALVDLICPEPVADRSDARRFEVHCGGALANVAVAARRAGAPAALASACGDDDRGRLIRSLLEAEGVDLRFYGVVPGAPTAFAFAYLDLDREPFFEIHGAGIEAAITSLAGREEEIAAAASAIVFGSNTLVDPAGREVTLAICEQARRLAVPLLFDPNLRPGRWPDRDAAREQCLPVLSEATVLKCNIGEARWLLADERVDAGAAADALHALGPELVVVTAGTAAAVCRGAAVAEAAPPDVELVSPLGAGDAFMGTLAAGLHAGGFDLSRAGDALTAAAEQGALACTHLGAFAS
ncbi:MAG: PfkB family carbohydrate kinase [Solirubrobacterales bacterium]